VGPPPRSIVPAAARAQARAPARLRYFTPGPLCTAAVAVAARARPPARLPAVAAQAEEMRLGAPEQG
jgi:hypothetical protein